MLGFLVKIKAANSMPTFKEVLQRVIQQKKEEKLKELGSKGNVDGISKSNLVEITQGFSKG